MKMEVAPQPEPWREERTTFLRCHKSDHERT